VAAGLKMPGVFEVPNILGIGRAIEDLLLIVECSLEGEWEGRCVTCRCSARKSGGRMDIQTRAILDAWIAVIVAALSILTTSQGQPTASAHYDVFTRDGSEVDLGFARKWLDAAEQLMATKYHVASDRYHMSVYLLYRPENDLDTTQSGQNRCCETDSQGRRTATIFLLGPSAPVWKERPLLSSLGLPKDGIDYHAKVLMSEYIPIGHYAVQDSRQRGGWPYSRSGANTFDEALADQTSPHSRTALLDSFRAWVRNTR
jgi:hypothetical protein